MLPKKIDRNKTYYKITNAEECHYGLQYKTGLNKDPMPFNKNPKASCCEGGIYFTTQEYIHKYFYKGCWVRKITIPKDARVVLDPSRSKYRTDKIILGKRYSFNKYFDEVFNKKTFPSEGYWCLSMYCSKYFNKWFDKKTYPKGDYWYLIKYCSNYFTEWFDKKTYPKGDYQYLADYCQKYKHIWE